MILHHNRLVSFSKPWAVQAAGQPFREGGREYAPGFASSALPKYAFNAKELDEETGMYYYEARYMAPPTFISRDPLFEQKPWLSPYHYCSNNPVGRVDPSGCEDGWVQDEEGNVFWDNNTNSQSEFEQNYSNRPGCAYVSDADNPKSYSLPSGEGKLVMNQWNANNDISGFNGVGGVIINISFIASDKNAEIGWVQTYTSNMTSINDASLRTLLPEENCREYLDGGPFGQTCNPENSSYFDNRPNSRLWDAPMIAKNDGAQYNPSFKAQSTVLSNGKRILSIGWGYVINSQINQTIFSPALL